MLRNGTEHADLGAAYLSRRDAASNARHRPGRRTHAKDLWSDRPAVEPPAIVWVAGESEQAAWVADRTLALRETGIALKSQAVLFRASRAECCTRARAGPAQHSLRQVRWPEIPRGRRMSRSVLRRCCASLPIRAASAPPGGRCSWSRAWRARATAPARLLIAQMAAPGPGGGACWPFAPPAGRHRRHDRQLQEICASLRAPGCRPGRRTSPRWSAGIARNSSGLHDDAAPRAGRCRPPRCGWRPAMSSRDRFLTELALDPPAASSDESGPGALDEDYLILSTIHSAKGQGVGRRPRCSTSSTAASLSDMATGNGRRDRGGAAAALRGDDPRPGITFQLLVPQRLLVDQQSAYGDRHMYAAISRFLPNRSATGSVRRPGGGDRGSGAGPAGPRAGRFRRAGACHGADAIRK